MQVMQLATSYWVSQAIYVATKLGIADLLKSGPKRSDELARACGAHPVALHRVLRALAGFGIFREDEEGRFATTPLGATLETGQVGRATVLSMAGPWVWSTFGELLHSVKTGKPAFEKVHGANVFDWFGKHPEEAGLFNDAMIGIHGGEHEAVAEAYDFGGIGTLVDVGGGTGNLLSQVLKRRPGVKGILQDLPAVANAARERLKGLADRCRVVDGSFFESVVAGGDAYMMSHVIHDWDEPRCKKILDNCRAVVPRTGRLLLVEMVIPAGNDFHPSKMLDVVMLAAPGGRERTEKEYAELLSASGFRLTRVVPTASPASVVEAVPA
jgi:hypothetical protein